MSYRSMRGCVTTDGAVGLCKVRLGGLDVV